MARVSLSACFLTAGLPMKYTGMFIGLHFGLAYRKFLGEPPESFQQEQKRASRSHFKVGLCCGWLRVQQICTSENTGSSGTG